MDAVGDLIAQDLPADPPEGFKPFEPRGGFSQLAGRYWAKSRDGRLIMAFRCSPRHLNPFGVCHGGMLATFADMQAFATRYEAGLREQFTPTVSLTVDYLRPVKLGDWVEAETELVKQGRTLIVSRTIARVGEKAVFNSRAIYTLGGPDDVGEAVLSVYDP